MLYLAPFIGTGKYRDEHGRRDGFRPLGTDGIRGWAMLDLRADCAKLDGRCLVWTPDDKPLTLEHGIVQIGNHHNEYTPEASRVEVRQQLGVESDGTSRLSGLLAAIMFPRHENRWNPVLAENWTGLRDVWIAGKLWARQRSKPKCLDGVDPTDTFVRANETPLAAPWVQLPGGAPIDLFSNAIRSRAAGDKFWYYTGSASTADHYSEFRQDSVVNSDDWGPAIRIGSAGFSGYFAESYVGNVGELDKFSTGAFTNISIAPNWTVANGDTIRLTGSGSTLTIKQNGTLVTNGTQTDTSLTTVGNGAGIFIYDTGGGLNNFDGADTTAATKAVPIFHRSQRFFRKVG